MRAEVVYPIDQTVCKSGTPADQRGAFGLGPLEHRQELAAGGLAQELEQAWAEVGIVHGGTLAGRCSSGCCGRPTGTAEVFLAQARTYGPGR